jgi:hypothetical protein
MAREGLAHPFLHRVMDERLQRQLPHLLPSKRQKSPGSNLWRLATFPLNTTQIHVSSESDDFVRCPYRADHVILHDSGEIERLVNDLRADPRKLRQVLRLAPDYLENPGLQLPQDRVIGGRLLELFAAGKLVAVQCRLTAHAAAAADEIGDGSVRPREVPFPFADRLSSLAARQQEKVKEPVKTWIAIELRDEDTGAPVPNERYRLVLPDGSTQEGNLDENRRAEVDEIDFGVCKVTFPDIHAKEWHPG